MWQSLHTAPRKDEAGKPVPIRLFLPGVNSKFNERGYPTAVAHGECVGCWDPEKSCWIEQKTGHAVYPSQWMPVS